MSRPDDFQPPRPPFPLKAFLIATACALLPAVSFAKEGDILAVCKIADKPSADTREMKLRQPDGTDETLLVERQGIVTEKDVAKLQASLIQPNALDVWLTDDGAEKFSAATAKLTPGKDRVAIVVGGKLVRAPVINHVPLGAQFVIEGLTEKESEQTAAEFKKPKQEKK